MDYEGFKAEILKLTGINLSLYKEKQMKRRIDSLIRKNGFESYIGYARALKVNQHLLSEFINFLTINVSEFYRNPEQWEVLKKDILPMLMKSGRRMKIWSAACSTGDEPYTLVMVLNEFMPLYDIRIIATDIDREALRKAKEGVYTAKSVEKLPRIYLDRYFTKKGDLYSVNDNIKSQVDFTRHNMLQDPYPADCDLIVCRNVLIYFTEEAKAQIYARFNKSLRINGILFVGSTEQIIMSNRYCFNPVKTFFYIKERDMQHV